MKTAILLLFAGLSGCIRPAPAPVPPPASQQTPAPANRTVSEPLPAPKPGKINGLTLVAPPEPFPADPMPAVRGVGANWIAVIPYGYTRQGEPRLHYNVVNEQWWGESREGAAATIRQARAAGLKVMLKPQVYIPSSWTGSLNFASEADWQRWEEDYETYIIDFARVAEETGAELFCIGTEFRSAIAKRPAFWHGLIAKVRRLYKGKITYSANWDDWPHIPFWGELDYIGLSGYFPLVEGTTPSVHALREAWGPIRDRLARFSAQHGKPVLFTEFGYLSVDGCGWRNWELEQGIHGRNINEQAQANCYEALLSVFQQESWWGGGFVWKWFPNMRGHEGYPERDYTPQGKKGEMALRKWYGK